MAAERLRLKLLIDNQKRKVLFAEAQNDFVNFLFSILTLPVGAVTKLLTKTSMVGSVGNLFESIENLSQIYMQPNLNKDILLTPRIAAFGPGIPLLRLHPICSKFSPQFYTCVDCVVGGEGRSQHLSEIPNVNCPECNEPMTAVMVKVSPTTATDEAGSSAIDGGYVKGIVTCMVMDDLVVQPMSTISGVTLLNKLNVKELGVLEEKVVDVGMKEALGLLKASLQSSTVLTDVFLAEEEEELTTTDGDE